MLAKCSTGIQIIYVSFFIFIFIFLVVVVVVQYWYLILAIYRLS